VVIVLGLTTDERTIACILLLCIAKVRARVRVCVRVRCVRVKKKKHKSKHKIVFRFIILRFVRIIAGCKRKFWWKFSPQPKSLSITNAFNFIRIATGFCIYEIF